MMPSNPVLFARTARECSAISARASISQMAEAELIFPMDREDWGQLRTTYRNRVRGREVTDITLGTELAPPGLTWENGPYGLYAQFDSTEDTRFETLLSMYARRAGTLCVFGKAGPGGGPAFFSVIGDNMDATGDFALRLVWGNGASGLTWRLVTATGARSGNIAGDGPYPYDAWHLTTLDWGPLGIRVFYNDILVDGDADTGATCNDPKSGGQYLWVNRVGTAARKTGIGFLGFWSTQRGPDIAADLLRRRRYVA
jgi:hypothetical protein